MWFIAIGGFERTMKKLIGSVVSPFTEKMFVNAILGNLFLMKKNRDPQDQYDNDDPKKPKGFVKRKKGTKKEVIIKDISVNKMNNYFPYTELEGFFHLNNRIRNIDNEPEFMNGKERDAYILLKKDISRNKISSISIRAIIYHVIKNRKSFNIVQNPGVLCKQEIVNNCCPCWNLKRKKN